MQLGSRAELNCPHEYLEGLDPSVLDQIPVGEPLILDLQVTGIKKPEPFDESLLTYDMH